MLQTDGIGLFSFSFVSSSAVKKVKIFKKQNKTREHTGTPFSDSDGLACVGSIAYVTIECGPRPS